jgi:hypothetical protein
MMHDVFISHTSKNKQAADAICHVLEENGVRCWIAPRDIPPGSKYGEQITKGIRDCKVFLLVFSGEVNRAPAVEKELERAALGYKKPVIPFCIEDAPMNDNIEFFVSDVHRIEAFREKHWIDAYPNGKVFDELLGSVRGILGTGAKSTESDGTNNRADSEAHDRAKDSGVVPLLPQKQKGSIRMLKWAIPAAAVVLTVTLMVTLFNSPKSLSDTGGNSDAFMSQTLMTQSNPFLSDVTSSSEEKALMQQPTDTTEPQSTTVPLDNASELNETGNTVGNLANNGLIAQKGDLFFYSNPNDADYLYRIHIDGSDKTSLTSTPTRDINIVGDWVYYSLWSWRYSSGTSFHGIYKMRIDGSGVSDEILIIDDAASGVAVVNGWIYYCNHDANRSVFKVRLDGSDRTQINRDDSAYISIVEDWIYYKNSSSDGYIYKVRTDGSDRTKLNDEACYFMTVEDDWIYYTVVYDGHIYKMRTDGSEKTKINDDNSDNFNVSNGWVYYSNVDDDDSLYRIRTDGGGRTKLNSYSSEVIHVLGEWVYYVYNNTFYKIRTDGTEDQLFE